MVFIQRLTWHSQAGWGLSPLFSQCITRAYARVIISFIYYQQRPWSIVQKKHAEPRSNTWCWHPSTTLLIHLSFHIAGSSVQSLTPAYVLWWTAVSSRTMQRCISPHLACWFLCPLDTSMCKSDVKSHLFIHLDIHHSIHHFKIICSKFILFIVKIVFILLYKIN